MPQGPIAVQQQPSQGGTLNKLFLNSTTPVVIKAAKGMIATVVVLAAGSGTGGVYDATATAAAVTANQVAVIPETVGPVQLNFPCLTGIVVQLGTGQEASISYS